MTKPSKPEFTTYESAVAFLEGGRKKDSRPTKDGWNTKLIVADDGPTLVVHDSIVATFRKDDTISIPNIIWDRTATDRINRYILTPRGMWMSGGSFYVVQPIAHTGNNYQDIVHRWDGKEPLIVTARGIGGTVNAISQDHIKDLVDAFVMRMGYQLKVGLMPSATVSCQMCVTRIGDGRTWGEWLGDPEHLFGHLINSYHPDPNFLYAMLAENWLVAHPSRVGAFIVPDEHMEDAKADLARRILEEISLARP